MEFMNGSRAAVFGGGADCGSGSAGGTVDEKDISTVTVNDG